MLYAGVVQQNVPVVWPDDACCALCVPTLVYTLLHAHAQGGPLHMQQTHGGCAVRCDVLLAWHAVCCAGHTWMVWMLIKLGWCSQQTCRLQHTSRKKHLPIPVLCNTCSGMGSGAAGHCRQDSGVDWVHWSSLGRS